LGGSVLVVFASLNLLLRFVVVTAATAESKDGSDSKSAGSKNHWSGSLRPCSMMVSSLLVGWSGYPCMPPALRGKRSCSAFVSGPQPINDAFKVARERRQDACFRGVVSSAHIDMVGYAAASCFWLMLRSKRCLMRWPRVWTVVIDWGFAVWIVVQRTGGLPAPSPLMLQRSPDKGSGGILKNASLHLSVRIVRLVARC